MGVVLLLKSGNDMLVVSGIDMCCLKLYRGVLFRGIRLNLCGGVCFLLEVTFEGAGLCGTL